MPRFLNTILASPLSDGRQWCIRNVAADGKPDFYRYLSDVPGVGLIEIPWGFVTDWASIPQALWSILPPWGLYGAISAPHDWEYKVQRLSRNQADDVLQEGSLLLGVDEKLTHAIYTTVREFGQESWDRNKALKDSGYKRMSLGPDDPPYAGIPE